MIISQTIQALILYKAGIDINDITYYASGRCGDIFLYHGGLLKISPILDLYTYSSDIQNAYDIKLKFQNTLNLCGLYVPQISPWENGKLAKIVKLEGNAFCVYKMQWLNGKHLISTELKPANVRLIGKAILTFMNTSSNIPYDTTEYLQWKNIIPKHYNLLPPHIKEQISRLKNRITATTLNLQYIHYDMSIQNIIFNKRMGFIDFDNVCISDKTADIAGFLYSILNVDFRSGIIADSKYFRMVADELFKELKLTNEDVRKVDLFMQYRRLFLFSVFYDTIKKANPSYYDLINESINNEIGFLEDYIE